MKIIKTNSLGEAYESAVKYVLQNGTKIITEDHEHTLESDPICIIVENPLLSPINSKLNPIKINFLEKYAHDLVEGTNSIFDYDYHTRLFEWGSHWMDISVDQIQSIISKLKDHSETRRAIAITNEPPRDISQKNIPCLQLLQCVIRNNKLNMTVVFRSNDILLGLGANMYGFTKLQQYIADQIGYEMGNYTHIALIPHIYNIRDACYLKDFVDVKRTIHYVNP